MNPDKHILTLNLQRTKCKVSKVIFSQVSEEIKLYSVLTEKQRNACC